MNRVLIVAMALVLGISANWVVAADAPAETIRRSELVLADLMAIPARQIPQHLLAGATAVAVIPDVTKIGFVAGVRHGHGVVVVRDADGEWSLPQFVTLTGGSVGGQAGIQGTDIVLVFKTRRGVEGLLKGKFTIGVDASVSAGPLGLDTEAATDALLQAEILSYSRSRGLFVGVSIDGSALEMDHFAHLEYYGSGSAELPRRVPESATQFRQYLVADPTVPVRFRNGDSTRSLAEKNGGLTALADPARRAPARDVDSRLADISGAAERNYGSRSVPQSG